MQKCHEIPLFQFSYLQIFRLVPVQLHCRGDASSLQGSHQQKVSRKRASSSDRTQLWLCQVKVERRAGDGRHGEDVLPGDRQDISLGTFMRLAMRTRRSECQSIKPFVARAFATETSKSETSVGANLEKSDVPFRPPPAPGRGRQLSCRCWS